MDALRRIMGREQSLDQFHLVLRRAAAAVKGISSYGACLVTCSDERLGLTRAGFDRDVATPLISDVANARDRVFSVSNMCGRLEPGAFALIDDHFTRSTSASKLVVMQIASHVGRIKHGETYGYGRIGRFGRESPCCGALTSLLAAPNVTGTVRHPWFEQLNAFFGPVRLAALRGIGDATRMVAAAIVHAALQAESAVSDILQHPSTTRTDVLLAAGVAINQQWADGFLPVAYHHLSIDGGVARIVSGFSLRTTPEALKIDVSGARIEVEGGQLMEEAPRVQRHIESPAAEAGIEPVPEETLAALADLTPEHREELDKRLEAVRGQVESIRHDPEAWRTYSRPILRGLFRGLSVVQPELGVAAMLYEGGEKLFASHRLKQVILRGPSTQDGRRVLHDIEAELQQLNHEDAQQVLDILLAKK
jgi:hypothetical protein